MPYVTLFRVFSTKNSIFSHASNYALTFWDNGHDIKFYLRIKKTNISSKIA